jgi:hypothetical protein
MLASKEISPKIDKGAFQGFCTLPGSWYNESLGSPQLADSGKAFHVHEDRERFS